MRERFRRGQLCQMKFVCLKRTAREVYNLIQILSAVWNSHVVVFKVKNKFKLCLFHIKVMNSWNHTDSFLFYLFFSHKHIPTTIFPHSSQHPLPSIADALFCFSSEKKANFPVMSTGHSVTRCNKTRHKPSYQGWTRQPSRRKRVPRVGKKVRDTCTPTVRSTKKNPKLNCHSTHAEDLT